MATPADLVLLARELGQSDVHVVTEAIAALGHAWDEQAAQLILDHVRLDHPNAEIRLAVAQNLPHGVQDETPLRDAVIDALITLSGDENPKVRDWACFGLGQMDADSAEVRTALAARLADPDDDARCEALLALAKVGDPRAATALQLRLAGDSDDLWLLEVKAAGELADPQLHPLLVRLNEEWSDDDDEFTPALAFATSRCRPDAEARASRVERELLTRVGTLLTTQGLVPKIEGSYPRSGLTFQTVEGQASPVVFDAIWADEDPWNYPLEQMAQSFVLFYASEAG